MDCYDEPTFERCMQSVALQTVEDYEVMVVGMRDMQEITAGASNLLIKKKSTQKRTL